MKKTGKVLSTIIFVVFVLGLVCIGAGIITGAEKNRIFNVLDNRFQLESTLNLYSQYFSQIGSTIFGLFR